MPQPTPYNREYSFTDYQAQNPSAPLPAVKVDAELDHVADTLRGVLQNLLIIQRDDGRLTNEIVDLDAIEYNVLLAIAAAVVSHTRGENAPSPNFTFTTTTLAPGAQATVNVTGTYPDLTVQLGIPKGDPSIGGATLEDGDYGDVVVSSGGSAMAVQTVGGEDPFRPSNKPVIADVVGLADALAQQQGAADWANITNKPATFPPSTHNHDGSYYTKAQVNSLLDGKQDAGSYVTAGQLAAKADAITAVKSFSTAQTVSDATHNGCYNRMTGATSRNITFGSTPSAGHASIWVNRGTVNMTVVCGGGYYKDGASATATANFALAPGDKLTAFHEGSGVWTFEVV